MDASGRSKDRRVVYCGAIGGHRSSAVLMAPRLVDLTGRTRTPEPRGLHLQGLEYPLLYRVLPGHPGHLLDNSANDHIAEVGVLELASGAEFRLL